MREHGASSNDDSGKSVKVVDVSEALARLGGDAGLLRDMAAICCEDGPKLLGDLRTAVDRGDAKGAERAAHSLKGLTANFNAEATVRLAGQIEAAARTGDLTTAAHDVPTLAESFDRVRAALEALSDG